MPKRVVKHLSWEVISEQMPDSPAVQRRVRRGLIKDSLTKLVQFENDREADVDLFALACSAFAFYHLEQYFKAHELAGQAINAATVQASDKNRGNALHAGHTVLGLLALKNRNNVLAIHHLHTSAKVPSTPVLMSFGPRMLLAKELLILGETQAVLTYFSLCRSFWTHGELWLSVWERKIQVGKIPNFSMHLTFV